MLPASWHTVYGRTLNIIVWFWSCGEPYRWRQIFQTSLSWSSLALWRWFAWCSTQYHELSKQHSSFFQPHAVPRSQKWAGSPPLLAISCGGSAILLPCSSKAPVPGEESVYEKNAWPWVPIKSVTTARLPSPGLLSTFGRRGEFAWSHSVLREMDFASAVYHILFKQLHFHKCWRAAVFEWENAEDKKCCVMPRCLCNMCFIYKLINRIQWKQTDSFGSLHNCSAYVTFRSVNLRFNGWVGGKGYQLMPQIH